MKRINKSPIILLATASLLTSCSNGSIAGTYSFQMGKESGTHFGLSLKLTDKYITLESQPEVTKKYKSCELSFSFKNGQESGSYIDSLIEMLKKILGEEGEALKIPGYYYKGDKKARDGAIELKLGVDMAFIKDKIPGAEEETFPVIEPDTIEKLIYTTYLKEQVTLNIPVSEIDAFYQLFWYGFDVTYSSEDGIQFIDSSCGAHEPGTHPTAADVEEINKTFATDHAALQQFLYDLDLDYDLSEYRDYYTLAMGLIKK